MRGAVVVFDFESLRAGPIGPGAFPVPRAAGPKRYARGMSRRASAQDRAYFERIARQNRTLEDAQVPGSLSEMFDRLEHIRRTLGRLAVPGVEADDEGDLASHRAFLERVREIGRRGANRA